MDALDNTTVDDCDDDFNSKNDSDEESAFTTQIKNVLDETPDMNEHTSMNILLLLNLRVNMFSADAHVTPT